MKKTLIGIGSQIEGGKNTVGNYLITKLHNFQCASFAAKVKRIFCETFDVSPEFIEKWKRIDKCPPGFDMTVRQALIFIGDGFRKIQANIWINSIINRNDNLVIVDARYFNEFIAIRNKGGIVILLWRPGYENDLPNASEQEVVPFIKMLKNEPDGIIDNERIPFDLWIKNDGSEQDLYDKIDRIVIPFVEKRINAINS